MDPFDDLLRGVRADGAGFSRTELSPPWALRFGDAESLTLLAPLRGEGWISFGEGENPRLVRAGDAAIARGPAPFAISDRPEPGRAEPADRTVLRTATYRVRGKVSQRLLGVLPPVLVVPDGDGCASIRGFLDSQIARVRQVVLDRLLVCTLRGCGVQAFHGVSPSKYRQDAACAPRCGQST
ncbi:cupin domain-containing protein [Saccharopolyspora shandongensis]|uniref:cupin domain-containing protein n=1 Tax=Saccharopolyspora shandongensis TaxID=418495 RepID=UPI00343DDF25